MYINIGDLIRGQYEIVKRLGQGGFGAVYEVHDKKNNNHPYAMKVGSRYVIFKFTVGLICKNYNPFSGGTKTTRWRRTWTRIGNWSFEENAELSANSTLCRRW